MSISILQKYLPENALPYLKNWFGDFYVHIKITKGRNSKLGDYRKLPDNTHQITVNSTLPPQLFFFVLTHELAHLLAFEHHLPRRISAHGMEWKHTFREMLRESLCVYSSDLQPMILKFSKSPKANFMASPDIVKYFYGDTEGKTQFVESLNIGDNFGFKNQNYRIEEKLKKRYICKNLDNGKKYYFSPLAKVEKL